MTIEELKQAVAHAKAYVYFSTQGGYLIDPETLAYAQALVQLHDTVQHYVLADESTPQGAHARERLYEQLYQTVLP